MVWLNFSIEDFSFSTSRVSCRREQIQSLIISVEGGQFALPEYIIPRKAGSLSKGTMGMAWVNSRPRFLR
jgi:hypothetical protein